MDLILSQHALEQARERGVSINEIKKTIQQGAKHLQPPGKVVAEYAHVRVVYKREIEKVFVITVMIRK